MSEETYRPTKFCWVCSRKLWGGKGVVLMVDGQYRTMHKHCSERREEYNPSHPCRNCKYKDERRDLYPCSVCEAF
jgi:hypothetical protein